MKNAERFSNASFAHFLRAGKVDLFPPTTLL